ncbi:hypothetical protein BB561_002264 [Smittium simulii]|uniref:Uncharacterized protein n=1 Tax=Smittium simulii TaxID=133385 RepID=A0A2T9YR32_9FUNG|nr:hypothetical protein BB561_002264 [Smittium simulii]
MAQRSNYCTVSHTVDLSDHLPIQAEWGIESIIKTKKISKISSKIIEKHANVLLNHNRFAVLANNNADFDALCNDTVATITDTFTQLEKSSQNIEFFPKALSSKTLMLIKKRQKLFHKTKNNAELIPLYNELKTNTAKAIKNDVKLKYIKELEAVTDDLIKNNSKKLWKWIKNKTRAARVQANGPVLNKDQAPGTDGLPSEIWKLVQNEPSPDSNLARLIYKIINLLYSADKIPPNWATSIVVPVPKKGDLNDPNNYRGLTFEDSWKWDGTIINNKNKMNKAMYGTYSFLKNQNIPVAIRLKVLQSVLIPIGTYGGELFGMSEVRTRPIQIIADKSLRLIANVSKATAINRLRTEFGISSINSICSRARERAYFKWPISKTWIADLIRQPLKLDQAHGYQLAVAVSRAENRPTDNW